MRSRSVLACLLISGFCVGCGSMPSSKSPATLSSQGQQLGRALGGQSPITGATIQLWQVNAITDGGLGTAMLSGTVTSSDGSGNAANSNANAGNLNNSLPAGSFTITNAYTCPPGDALVYITASGGNPGLSAGTNNPQSQMVTALGSCNNLKNNVLFINISEQTTVATVAALYPFMTAYNAIGASPAHAPDLAASFALVNEYVDFQAGTAPGPALPAGYSASTGDVNLEANILANCVDSSGGTIGDGSACGTLFSYTYNTSTYVVSTDVTAAALYMRINDSTYAGSLTSLARPQAPFQPASTSVTDWSLPIFQLPVPPTFSLPSGTYSSTQLLQIQDADAAATIYWINGTGTPSLSLNGVLTVNRSETITASAVARGITSATSSATYTITAASNVPTVSVTSATLNVGSTATTSITASSNATGSVVTFGASGSVGGTFTPASCTVSGGSCSVTYTPSGTASAGTYASGLTASFTATGSYNTATAAGIVYVVAADTVKGLASNNSGQVTLIQASDGNFYGLDQNSGAFVGRLYRMDSSGNVTTLYQFTGGTDGLGPEDHLVQGSDGSFYGVAFRGGAYSNGTIYKVDASGNFTLLYTFTGSIDGARPGRALVQGTDGSFYGTTSHGGAYGYGTVFKIDSSGNFTLLHGFAAGTDGAGSGTLLQGADGNFYGVSGGGLYDAGTVYKMDTSGNVTILYNFTGLADGTQPVGLVQGTDGNFYGATYLAGAFNGGTLFKIDSSGNFAILHSFTGTEGDLPEGVPVQASDGAFYGTAQLGLYGGSLYKIDSAGNFTVLHDFTNTGDGFQPDGGLVQSSDGSFYGGTSINLFKLTTTPALSGPITLTVPASVTHGTSFTLTYTVSNAGSQTMQRCFATNNSGDVTGWTGVKTASTASTNATLTAPSTAGTYSYALTCGGVESGFVTLNVN
jgi:uncharacterized repeat protein (TIGR03803 family)